ncbi:hypothetical protein E3N88_15828 [Mikania micrantha]|uniref:Integrase catalytic domain-containing protein n=1 Tax=Mikania micrantha TaxID=192012 RepID=A0A5N6NXX8_9ASTR|nr:hypothetical protein E3N88_15828 [Mikania micrantha]
MFDTGASHLSEYDGPDEIVLGNGKTLSISHMGHTSIPTSTRTLSLNDVLLVPHLRSSYEGATHVGVNINDVYYASPFPHQPIHQLNSSIKTSGSPLSWHHKFGHPSIKVLKLLLNNLGLGYYKMSNASFYCDACSLNKIHKQPFGENSFKVSKPLELIYSDVWGPVQTSNDGYAYYVIFVDFYSKYTWLYPIKQKSDVAILFPQFKSLVEKFFKTPLVSLFSDNGGEYIGLIPYLLRHGISHFTTPPHTPEQNGVAERRHRHIVETRLSLLHHANLPLNFWSHAFQIVVYLNQLPTQILNFMSPYEQLYKIPPTYMKLKPFDCLCFPWLRPYASSKLYPRSIKCIILGYSSKSAYKCYDPESHRLYHSRHVEFIDHIFPFTKNGTVTNSLPTPEKFIPTGSQKPKSHATKIHILSPLPIHADAPHTMQQNPTSNPLPTQNNTTPSTTKSLNLYNSISSSSSVLYWTPTHPLPTLKLISHRLPLKL